MNKNTLFASLFALSFMLAACDSQPGKTPAEPVQTQQKATPAKPAPKAPAAKASSLPSPQEATDKAPAVFRARFTTTKGDFVVEATRAWAPQGADRFYNLVKIGYFKEIAFFRVVDNFMVQFGIHGDPAVSAKWRPAMIPDDPAAGQSNTRGQVTFAMAGPNTRTTQFFVNFKNNAMLDSMGFPPFGKVVEGMSVVDSLYKGYGEGAPRGSGPAQGRIQTEGNTYLKSDFPKLDYIKSARLE